MKLANTATDWASVLEQPWFRDFVDRLPTRRPWEIEEIVEAGEAGWTAYAREGGTIFMLSLTMPVEAGESPPPRIIEWTLEAGAERDEPRRFSFALAAIMLGMGALFGWLGFRWGVRLALPIVVALGMFPVGLFLGVFVLDLIGTRRERRRPPVPGRAEFLKEVASAVAQSAAQP